MPELRLSDLQEMVDEAMEEAEIQLFAETEQLASRNARNMRRMALWAFAHRRDKRALAIASFNWDASAGNMARAVQRRPDWFAPGRNATVTEMRMLFVLGQADSGLDLKLYAYWREHLTLQPYEMQRMVSAYKKATAKPRPKRIKMRGKALHVNKDTKIASVELSSNAPSDVDEVVEGATYKIDLRPDERSVPNAGANAGANGAEP